MISFTSTPVAVNATRLKNNPQFGCRFSVTVADQGGLPAVTQTLQTGTPVSIELEKKLRTTLPNDSNIHTSHVPPLASNAFRHAVPAGTKVTYPKGSIISTQARVNTPSDWFGHRNPEILAAIARNDTRTMSLFLGPPRNIKHYLDLLNGGSPGAYNDHSAPIARISPTGAIKVSEMAGTQTLQRSPVIIEALKKYLTETTQTSIDEGAQAMLLHQRYATRGNATHQFEAETGNIHIGFLHNGSVDRVHEFETEVQELKQQTLSRQFSHDDSVRSPNQLVLDAADKEAWNSENDSYRYFLLILSQLKKLNNIPKEAQLTQDAFADTTKVALAIASVGLEMNQGDPADHPNQQDTPKKLKTYYQGVGYAGAFYFTDRESGRSFIMVLEGNKSPQIGVFKDPITQKHILKIDSEASQPDDIFEAPVKRLQPQYADVWTQMPKGSAIIIIKGPGEDAEEKVTVPFDLKTFLENPASLPEPVSIKDLPAAMMQTMRPKKIRTTVQNNEGNFVQPRINPIRFDIYV